jgi:hypothetical protein
MSNLVTRVGAGHGGIESERRDSDDKPDLEIGAKLSNSRHEPLIGAILSLLKYGDLKIYEYSIGE